MSGIREYYEDLTPRERAAWKDHLKEYPPGDFILQRQLAVLSSLIASYMSGKKVHPKEFGGHLKWEDPNTGTLEVNELGAYMEEKYKKQEGLNG